MANPWDETFDRVRVVYHPDYVYDRALDGVPALLDEAERLLDVRLPASYRAFMTRFGPGQLEGRFAVLPPGGSGVDGFGNLFTCTRHYRELHEPDEDVGGNANADWLRELVYFGTDELGDAYTWHPIEVTTAKPHECRIYHLLRGLEEEPEVVGDSFAHFLRWAAAEARTRNEEPSEPSAGFLFEPDSLRMKDKPKHSNVQRWLLFNNRTARLIAKSIRDDGRADAFPILADALQDAGCAHPDLLDACRTGDPDVDGRWVLQVLLGE